MKDRATKLGIGTTIAAGLAISASLYTSAHAQNTTPPPAGPRGLEAGALQRPNPARGDFQNGGFITMDAGPAVIANDPATLYIVKGNVVYKVSKDTMRLEGQVYLPMQPGLGGGGFRQNGQRPGTAGGAPPPKK
jgi:hypothetical protein